MPDPTRPTNDSASLEEKTAVNEMLRAILQNVRTQTIVLSITMILALVGNLFLAFLITKMSRRRLGPVQILILHTCAADICFALCTALPQMASTLTFPHFYGGDFLCKLVKYLQLIPMYASSYLLVAISIDRYVAICRPLLALRWKYRLVHILATIAWTSALLFSIPNIFNFRYDLLESTSIMSCLSQLSPEFERAWITVFVLLVWLLPTVAVAVLYTLVCATVLRSMRCSALDPPSSNNNDPIEATPVRRHSHGVLYSVSTTAAGGGGSSSTAVAITKSSLVRKSYTPSINSYKLKTVKLTMTIVVANFVLWAPFCTINVIGTYFPHVQIDDIIATCIILVGNANSCVNPWIYVIFNYKRVVEALCGNERPSASSRYRQILSSIKPPISMRKETVVVDRSMTNGSDNNASGRSRKTTMIEESLLLRHTTTTSLAERKISITHKNSAYVRCNSVGAMQHYSRMSLGDLTGYRK